MVWYFMKYERLVEIFVKSDLRDEIRELKQRQTYDKFLRNLIEKNERSPTHRQAGGRSS